MFSLETLFSLEALLIITITGLALSAVAFWITMVVHCFKNPALTRDERILWLLLLVIGKLLGAAVYFFLRYRKRGEAGDASLTSMMSPTA